MAVSVDDSYDANRKLAFEPNNQQEHNVPFEAVSHLFASLSHGCDVMPNADYNGIM